mgnify:CR=1 FL=1
MSDDKIDDNGNEEVVPTTDTESLQTEETKPAKGKLNEEDHVEQTEDASEPDMTRGVNFVIDSPIFGPEKDGAPKEDFYRLPIPSMTLDDYDEMIANVPRVEAGRSEETQIWRELLETAASNITASRDLGGSIFERVLDNPAADFRQYVNSEEGRLNASRPSIANKTPGKKLTGQAAVLKAQALMGLGTIIQVPLWHSGIWISIKAPSESDILELDQRIATEKAELGRRSNGVAFSNANVYIKNYLFNFIMARVYDCSLKDWTPDKLRETILITDFPLLVWGTLCTMYTNGYPYSRPCINDTMDCQHVLRETINVHKMLWTDNNAMSETQKKFMSKRNVKVTPEDIVKYQDGFDFKDMKGVEIGNSTFVDLRVPTIDQYLTTGMRWVDNIEAVFNNSLNKDLKGNARRDYLANQSKLTLLVQYVHYIKRVYWGEDASDGEVVERDRETIEDLFETFSRDEKVTERVLEVARGVIDRTTFSLTAIPTYKCPSCNHFQSDISEKYPELIPIEVDQAFFILTKQRLYQMISR